MQPNDLFETRRRWFEQYTTNTDNGVRKQPESGTLFPCPCCGYPTLEERGGYEICYLCNWEDDGQDDPRADEVWGGPNGRYSLSQARQNFHRYSVMYAPDRDTRIVPGDNTVVLDAKKAIVGAFDGMTSASDEEKARLTQVVTENHVILAAELARRIDEYEQRVKQELAETDPGG